MILIEEIEELFVDFDVSDRALGDDELFGIEVDMFSGAREAVSLFALGFGAFFDGLSGPEALSVASSEFAEGSAHWNKDDK